MTRGYVLQNQIKGILLLLTAMLSTLDSTSSFSTRTASSKCTSLIQIKCSHCKQTVRPIFCSPFPADGDDSNANKTNTGKSQIQLQEQLMETLSRQGAKSIAALSMPDRAKRAMLAEAVEDSIFTLTEKLELLLEEDGTILPKHREKAISIAKETEILQLQYQELVTGQPSSVLNALENIFD